MAQKLQDPIEPKTNWKMFFWIFIIAIINRKGDIGKRRY
jgi:hypothetical protein